MRTAAAYTLYTTWCQQNGYRPENVKNFNAAMSRHFEIKRKRPADGGNMTTMLVGCKLREVEYGVDEEESTSSGVTGKMNGGKRRSEDHTGFRVL